MKAAPNNVRRMVGLNGHVANGAAIFNHTDQGNAERFVHHHGENVRYVYPWKKWLIWDGRRWKIDDSGDVERRAKSTVRSMFHDADPGDGKPIDQELGKHALRSQSANRIRDMLILARSEPGIAAVPDDLDADPWLLNCENGTLDLRTGVLREHRREDLLTKVVGAEYDPDAAAPRFERFLEETLVEGELVGFVRRFAGYSLTGSTRERVIAVLHGKNGKNGKTTLVELLQSVMGDYATTTDTETVLARRNPGVGNDVAALKGARFVSAAEVEKGRRLAESKVKQLTGNDTVSARFLYAEPFTFKPEFKLWLSTNNKPEIQGTDDAIWDRIRLIPFTQRFDGPHADAKLPEKLAEERPGVLAWMVRGCAEWLANGLGDPESVRAATEGYREEMDVLGSFLDDRCYVGKDARAETSQLFREWKDWCTDNGEDPGTQTKFGRSLTERGFAVVRQGGSRPRLRVGVGLGDPKSPPKTGMLAEEEGG